MPINRKFISTGLALAVLASDAFATVPKPTGIWCYNCTPSQITSAVLASPTPIGVPIYVGDVVTGSTGAYMVYADVDDSHSPPIHTRQVENVAADPVVMSYLDAGIKFYKTTPIGWHKVLNDVYTGSDPHASAYTVSDFGRAQNDFNAWRNSTYGGANGFAHLIATILQGITIINASDPAANPTMQSTTEFLDGTKVTSQWDYSSASMKINPDLSVDSENNTVPYLAADGSSHHVVANRHFDDDYDGERNSRLLSNKLNQMDVPIQVATDPGAHPDPAPGGLQPIICVTTPGEDGETPQITCYRG